MKLLKYIKVSLLSLLVASSVNAYARYDRCDFRYQVSDIVSMCSEKSLSDKQLANIKNQYIKSKRLFPKFIAKHGYEWQDSSIQLTIYMMPKSTLNDRNLFSRPANQELLGRYKDWEGNLYTYYGVSNHNNTDLVHELAHYFNNNIPITDDDENEKIAELFERYYLENS